MAKNSSLPISNTCAFTNIDQNNKEYQCAIKKQFISNENVHCTIQRFSQNMITSYNIQTNHNRAKLLIILTQCAIPRSLICHLPVLHLKIFPKLLVTS